MKKQIFVCALCALALAACSDKISVSTETEAPSNSKMQWIEFTAGTPSSKTYLEANEGVHSVYWAKDDLASLFVLVPTDENKGQALQTSYKMTLTEGEESPVGHFRGEAEINPEDNPAIGFSYPAGMATGMRWKEAEGYEIRFVLPAVQTVCDGSDAPLAGLIEEDYADLLIAGSLLKVVVAEENADKFSKISIEALGGEDLAGTFWVVSGAKDESTGELGQYDNVASASSVVTFAPESGSIAAGTYYLSVLARPQKTNDDLVLSKGIRMRGYDLAGNIVTEVSSLKPLTIRQGYIENIGTIPYDYKPSVDVTSITLNKTVAAVESGKTTQLAVKEIQPINATSFEVTWSSSNPAVATVSETGLVTAVAIGTATITATSVITPSVSASCTVTVPDPSNQPNELTLTFDLTSKPTDWPATIEYETHYNITLTAAENYMDYEFDLYPANNGKGNAVASYNETNGYMTLSVTNYFGSPAISGYVLDSYKFYQAASTSTSRKSSLCSEVHAGALNKAYYDASTEANGKSIATGTVNTWYTFTVKESVKAANKRYYLVSGGSAQGISKIELHYTKQAAE